MKIYFCCVKIGERDGFQQFKLPMYIAAQNRSNAKKLYARAIPDVYFTRIRVKMVRKKTLIKYEKILTKEEIKRIIGKEVIE